MSEKSKLSKKKKVLFISLLSVIGLIIIVHLIQQAFHIRICFDPMGGKPSEIVVYKYGQTHTLTKHDPEFDIIYEQLRGEWTVTGSDLNTNNSCKSNYVKESGDIFNNSGMVVEVKYRLTRISTGEGSSGVWYDTLIFLLDFPKELPADINPFVKDAVEEMLNKNSYRVYLTNNGKNSSESFVFYNYPQKTFEYIQENFND